jgi:hypothetical protein
MKRILAIILAVVALTFCLSACKKDPYKDYIASNLIATPFETNLDDGSYSLFGVNKAKIIFDYEEYLNFKFNLNYTAGYFENNNLLVFVVTSCSSDGMVFDQILEEDGKLYPCFLRNHIGKNEAVTDDVIYSSYSVELAKTDTRTLGEIIYKYR